MDNKLPIEIRPPSPTGHDSGIPPELQALMGDLLQNSSHLQKMKEQTDMPSTERQKRIKERRGNTKDESTAIGIGLGKKLAELAEGNMQVGLSDNEIKVLNLDTLTQEQQISLGETIVNKIKDRTLTKDNIRLIIRRQYSDLTSGSLQIINPTNLQTSEQIIQEGERRITGENTLVEIQSAILEEARQIGIDRKFFDSVKLVKSIIPDLKDSPQWYLMDINAGILKALNNLENRSNLEAVSALIQEADLFQEGGVFNELAGKIREANETLTEFKKQEAIERKNKIHNEKMQTLEKDILQGTISLGLSDVGTRRDMAGYENSVRNYKIEKAANGDQSSPETYFLPFNSIVSNKDVANAIARKGLRSGKRPVTNQEVFRVLSTDQEVFESVVKSLADTVAIDYTGFSKTDYQTPEEWGDVWRRTLRASIYGYSLGVAEGSIIVKELAGERFDNNLRRSAFVNMLVTVFEEKNFLISEDIASMSKLQQESLISFMQFRKQLLDAPEQKEASELLESYLKSTIPADAVTAVKNDRQTMRGEKLRIQQQLEEHRQALMSAKKEALDNLTTVNAFQANEVPVIRAYWDEIGRLQEERDLNKWVTINTADKMHPKLQVNQTEQRRIDEGLKRADEEISRENQKGSQGDTDNIRRLRIAREVLAAQQDFIRRINNKFDNINQNNISLERRSALKGGDRGVFEVYPFSGIVYSEYYLIKKGQVEAEGWDRTVKGRFGENEASEAGKLNKEHENLLLSWKDIDASENFDDIRTVTGLLRDIKSKSGYLVSEMTTLRGRLSLESMLDSAANKFIKEEVYKHLQSKKLLQSFD